MKRTRKKQKKPIILLLLLIVLLITFFGESIKDIYEKLINQDKKATEVVSIDISEKIKEIEAYDENIIVKNDKVIRSYDFSGNIKWSKEVNNLAELTDKLYICDNGKVNVFDINKNLLWNINTNKKIISMIEDKGYLFLFTKNDNGLSQVDVIDEFGNTVSNVVTENKALMAYMNGDEKEFIITTLGFDNNNIVSELLIYNLDSLKLYSYSIEDEIIQDLVFKDNKIIVITDKKIFSIQNEKKIWEKDLKGNIIDIAFYNDYYYLLLDKDSQNLLEVIGFKGETVLNKQLNQKYDKILLNKENVYLKNDEKIIGFTNEGTEIFEYKKNDILDFNIKDRDLLIYTGDNLLVYKLIDKK